MIFNVFIFLAGEDAETLIMMSKTPDEQSLINHPVRQFIVDFIRVIVVDSLSLPVTGKNSPVIDLVLDAYPEKSSVSQQICYQTEVRRNISTKLVLNKYYLISVIFNV